MRGAFTRSVEARAAACAVWRQACIAATLAVVFASPAVAQTTRYWAPDAGAGGSGTWNNTDLFWAPNADGSGTKVAWNSTLTTNRAHFGGTAGTVTTGAAVSTNQIRFDTTGYLLAGDATNTITLNGTTPSVFLADGVAAEISAVLAGSAGISTGASGTTGGTLTLSGTSSLTGTAAFGGGEVVLATGGSLTAGTLDVGTGLTGATATLRIKSGAAFSASNFSTVGTNGRPKAAVVQEGGTATFGHALVLGTNGGAGTYAGSSSYTLEGGALSLADATNSFITVGRNATATFTQTGGTVTISRTTDAMTIGDYATGSYSITAGSLTMIGGSASNALLGFRGGSGTLDIGGTAAVRIRGSLFLAVNGTNSATTKGSATINLQGGDLAVNGIVRGRAGTPGTGANGAGSVSFTLSGGTLRPYSGNVAFGSATAGSNFDITLSGTAAAISGLDASATPVARTVDLYANLIGSGGVTLSGGTINLRGANTYSGGTTIGAGTVAILATSAVPTSGTYTILSGGTLADSSGFATVGGWLASGRIATASAGTLAFTAATESDPINLTGYDSLTLAATGTTEVSGTVTPSATGLRIFSPGTLTISSAVGGPAGLTKTGNGTLVLSGANTYQGTTTLAAGTLTAGSATALGSGGTISFEGGTLRYGSGVSADFSDRFSTAAAAAYRVDTAGQNVTWATPLVSAAGSLQKTGTGTLALTADATFSGTTTISGGTLQLGGGGTAGTVAGGIVNSGLLVVDRSDEITLAAAISGSGGLTKQGAGRLVLSGANSFTGAVTVAAGELTVAGGGLAGSGTRTVGAATGPASVLRIQAGSSVAATSFQVGNATIPNAAVIQEGGDLTVSSSLTMANTGAPGTYAGSSTYELQTGSMTFTGTGFLQVARNATSSFTQSGGTIAIARTDDALIVGDYAAGTYTLTAGSLTATAAGGNLVLGNRGGSGTLTIDGPTARMGFNGAGRFAANASGSTGSTATVNLLAGELAINSMSRLSSTGTVNFTLGGGTLRPYAANATFGSATAGNNFSITLSGTGSVISGLDAAATPVARTVEVRTPLVGSGGVTLSGGTLTLHTANTYAGPTTITPGTSVALPGSIANSSAVTVNGSLDLATKTTGFAFGSGQTLGGAGTVALPTTGPGVSLAGFLAPGNSPGTLTISGAGTFDITTAINGTTGRLLFELGTPGVSSASDLVLVPDGTLSIGTSLLGFDSFAFTPLAGFTAGTYPLFSANTISGLLDPARTTGSVGGLSAELTASGTEISLVVVPEPGAVALVGMGIVAAGFALRRRTLGR